MFTDLRKFTVIFLAILQLIAPLVHAHAGEKVLNSGLHVPGLEMYGSKQAVFMSVLPSHDFGTTGVIVGVDAGIKDKPADVIADNSLYLPTQAPVFNPAISAFEVNFSPQSQQFISARLLSSLSPRAPPAQ